MILSLNTFRTSLALNARLKKVQKLETQGFVCNCQAAGAFCPQQQLGKRNRDDLSRYDTQSGAKVLKSEKSRTQKAEFAILCQIRK